MSRRIAAPPEVVAAFSGRRNKRTGQVYTPAEIEEVYRRWYKKRQRKDARELHYDIHGHHGPA